mgnify:CR=1 FL=1
MGKLHELLIRLCQQLSLHPSLQKYQGTRASSTHLLQEVNNNFEVSQVTLP